MLNFDDIKNNTQKVIDYLDTTLLTDSTVTMMTDEYIKQSVTERLTQVVLSNEGLVSLNTDTKALTRAMLRSSLSPEDVNFILNASLKVSEVKIAIVDTEKETSKSKKDEPVDPEHANKLIKDKMDSMCSIENLISIIRDNLGTSRVLPVPSMLSKMDSLSTGLDPVCDMLYVERPLELNLDFVDLSSIDNGQIFSFLNCLMSSDSNSELGIQLPLKAFIPTVQDFFKTDLPIICDAAIAFARASAKNSVSFTSEPDPYQTLFNTL